VIAPEASGEIERTRARTLWPVDRGRLQRPLVVRLATAFAVAVLIIGRRPESFFRPQLWAEDGPVFYGPELIHGALQTLLVPYAGYLQIVSRLTSILAARLPAEFAPAVFAFVAYAIAVWAASMFVEDRFEAIVGSRMLRFLTCCAFVVVPPSHEIIGTITNAHWFMALATFLLLIGKPLDDGPRTRLHNVWSAFAIALCGLSAPETLLFVPIALVRLVRMPVRFAQVVPLTFLIAIGIQGFELVTDPLHASPSAHSGIDATVFATAVAFVHRVLVMAMFGQPVSQLMTARQLAGLSVLCLLAFTAAATLAVRDCPRARWRFVGMLGVALLLLATAIDGRGLVPLFPSFGAVSYDGGRYFVLPIEALILAVAVVVDDRLGLAAATRSAIFVTLFACGAVLNYRVQPLPDLHWSQYAPALNAWIDAQRHARPAPLLSIPINPGWALVLPALTFGGAQSAQPKDAPIAGQHYGYDGVWIAGKRLPALPDDVIPVNAGQSFDVTGWAVDPRTLAPLKGLSSRIDSLPTHAAAVYGSVRPDVASALGSAQALNSGFAVRIKTDGLTPGQHRLTFTAIAADGRLFALPTRLRVSVAVKRSSRIELHEVQRQSPAFNRATAGRLEYIQNKM
jgi:hypothetical protein